MLCGMARRRRSGGGGGVLDVARRLMLLSLACCCSIWPGGRIFAAADTDPNDRELETSAFTVLLLPCEFVCLSARSAFLLDVFGLGESEICGWLQSKPSLYMHRWVVLRAALW